eukprot:919488-Prymnesium_polylepis.1
MAPLGAPLHHDDHVLEAARPLRVARLVEVGREQHRGREAEADLRHGLALVGGGLVEDLELGPRVEAVRAALRLPVEGGERPRQRLLVVAAVLLPRGLLRRLGHLL